MTGKTVFIVDDDDSVRESLSVLLRAKKYAAPAFASAEAFLAGYQPASAACAIVDLRLPGMDGLALLEQFRARGIHLPTIMVTGHGDVPLAVRAMKAGAVDFIEKPYTNTHLIEAIERAFGSMPAGASEPADRAEIQERVADLTPRERDVLYQLVIGNPNKVIAHHLSISPRTVEIHRANVMKKMNAESLSHLVRMALSVGVGEQLGSAKVK